MLVLTRKFGETIVIPQIHMTIKLLRHNGNFKPNYNQIRIGIEAPLDITILRGEIIERGDYHE